MRYLYRGACRLISAENCARATTSTSSAVCVLACCSQRVKHNEELRRTFSAACGEPAQENERVRRAAWCGSNIEVCFSEPQEHHDFLLAFDPRVRTSTLRYQKPHHVRGASRCLRCPPHIITVLLTTLTRFQVQGSANCPLAVSHQQCSVYIWTLPTQNTRNRCKRCEPSTWPYTIAWTTRSFFVI